MNKLKSILRIIGGILIVVAVTILLLLLFQLFYVLD